MSHNVTGIPPYVISYTPSYFTGSGNQTLSITIDNNASPTCLLDFTSALGTIVGAPVFTRTSSTESTLVYTINIAPTGSASPTYTLKLSHGGLDSAGADIKVTHGWSPALLVAVSGGFYDAADLALNDGDPVSSWAVTAGTHSPLTQPVSGEQPVYKAAGINGLPSVAFSGSAARELLPDPAEWTSGGQLCVLWQFPQIASQTSNGFFRISNIEKYYDTYNMKSDDTDFISRTAGGGSAYGSWSPTPDTTVRHYIITRSGTTGRLYDGATQILALGATPSSTYSRYLYVSDIDVAADPGLLISQVIWCPTLTADDITQLITYWTSRYGP